MVSQIDRRVQSFDIRRIHTLGPTGTNCEAAARAYSARHGLDAEVSLHPTLELALDRVLDDRSAALLGCVVYPDLHKLVFPYLGKMRLEHVFMFDTFNMVFAVRDPASAINTVASHPAPCSLVDTLHELTLVNSNSEAARLCGLGHFDACITTLPAAKANGLTVIQDHGPVPMGFSIHVPVN